MQLQWRAGALLLLASVIASAGQEIQAPTPQPSLPTMRITVTLVQVDAVVTNSSGKHVAGLQAADFEILQDGQPQRVSYFSYVPGTPPPVLPTPEGDRIPIGPPPPITPRQVRRVIALVVDDLALDFNSLVHTREALREFVQHQMEPGDLVAIVRTAGGVAILEQFTTDRALLLEAVDLLKWRFSGRTGIIPIQPLHRGSEEDAPRDRPQVLDYGYPMQSLGALATIEQVIHGMQGLPGRKSVIFLSDGLRVDSTLATAIDEVTDLANRSAVALYAVDPGGLRASARRRNQDPRITVPNDDSLERFPTLPAEDDLDLQQGLDTLARRTGGLFYHDRNDIARCISEASEDQLGYYLLGYSPREGTFEKEGGKAKFHRVTVKVRTPGLSVRWKSGFNGVPDQLTELRSDRPRTREQQLVDALASPFHSTGIRVRLTSNYNESKKSGPVVQSLLHFEAKSLDFKQDAEGMWHAMVDIVTSAYRGFKEPMQQRQRQQPIRLNEEQYRIAMKDGLVFNLADKMNVPGPFVIRAVVRDANNARIGSASHFVQVPDTRKHQLALSGIMLKQAPSELVATLRGTQAEPGESWSQGGPALRRYLPGQSILYGYAVINPKIKGGEPGFKAGSLVRVFRDGQLIYTGEYAHALARSELDPTRLVGGGVLSLGKRLIAGEYLLQVIVTDEQGDRKHSQVAQWVDFEVVGHTPGASAVVAAPGRP